MIIDSLVKNKKNKKYTIVVNDSSYEFDEEVILEYRLVKGKEITNDILDSAIKKNSIISYYYKALDYALKYGKSKRAIKSYLKEKGLANEEIIEIISLLEKNKVINDNELIKGIISSYIRKSYGMLMIEQKLIERKFDNELIKEAIDDINHEEYINSLIKLYEKVKNKYTGDSYTKTMKIKKYLLSRGYTYEDVNSIQIKG